MWCAMSEDDDARLNKTNKNTTCTFTCQVSRFMCTVLLLVVTSSLVSDVLSFGFTTHTFSKFLLDVAVRLNLVIVNSDRENGSFEVLSLHLPSVTIDRRQL